MYCFPMHYLCLCIVVSTFLLGIPEIYSLENDDDDISESINNIEEMLKALPEPYNQATVKQAFDAQVGDECTPEAWKELTKPFWEENFNKDRVGSEEAFTKAHVGWMEFPEYAGKSCFNNRHIRPGDQQTFPALPLRCHSGKCVCYNNVLGTKKFNLRQMEMKYKSNKTDEKEIIDCVGDTGSNCNPVLFPCNSKNKCSKQVDGLYLCKSKKFAMLATVMKEIKGAVKKEGRKPVVKKELRGGVLMDGAKENIPEINTNNSSSFEATSTVMLLLGIFSSRLCNFVSCY